MKRGWWIVVIFLVILTIALVSAKTYDFSECWGASICGSNYTCGRYDGLCVDAFFANQSAPYNDTGCLKDYSTEGYRKCIDPDCISCVSGTVTKAPPSPPDQPVVNATITYEQDVWDGITVFTLKKSIKTDAAGQYIMNVSSGNEIYLIAEGQGYTPELRGPIFNFDSKIPELDGACLVNDFELSNGTCTNSCVRTGSNYCDASCQGEGIPDLVTGKACDFNQSSDFITSDSLPITIESPYSACTSIGTQTSSIIKLGTFNLLSGDRMCVMTSCCEGNPFEIPCPETNISQTLVTGNTLPNAIKNTRIVKEKGTPYKMSVYYWE